MDCKDQILIDAWYIVAQTGDILPGKTKQAKLLGEDIILWRSANQSSTILAWKDSCPHRGTPLSLGNVENDRIACPYHGWQYDQSGQCVHIPSLGDQSPPKNFCVKTYLCKEYQNYIWISLGRPNGEPPSFPEWDNSDYNKITFDSYHFRTSGFRAAENNFDLSHLPFVHGSSLGDTNIPIIEKYKVKVGEDGVTLLNICTWQGDPDGTNTGKGFKVMYPFIKIYHPLSIYALKKIGDTSKIMQWVVNITPLEEEECLVWFYMAINHENQTPESDIREFMDNLFREDALIVESQRPVRLPISSNDGGELHVQCDLASVRYRRWLKQLGITYGVC